MRGFLSFGMDNYSTAQTGMVLRKTEWQCTVDGLADRETVRDGSDVGQGRRTCCGMGCTSSVDLCKEAVAYEPSSPTRLTQRRRSAGRGKEFAAKPTSVPPAPKVCSGCGATTHEGRLCRTCGRKVSGEQLIELAKRGRVVAQSQGSQAKRSASQTRHEAAKRAWRSTPERVTWPDEKIYMNKIQPQLSSVPISVLSSALGVCESYAADIRAGRRRPHARHWEALARLAGLAPDPKLASL